MDLKINASELKDNVLFAGAEKHKDNKNASGKTVFGANLNLANDPIENKKQEARKQAMKLVNDAWGSDNDIDKSIASRNDHFKEMQQAAYEANQQTKSIKEQQDALLEEYNGDTSNPEYIERAIGLSKQLAKYDADAQAAQDAMVDDVADVHAISIERLKSHGMVDASNAADDIMAAANKEIVGEALVEAKDNIDEKMEENEEAAKKKQEDDKKQEDRLEDLQNDRKLQEAVISGNKEAIAEARQQQQNNHSTTDVSMDDIVDAAVNRNTTQNVQQGLDDIKNSMSLLEADLKGIKVDKEV